MKNVEITIDQLMNSIPALRQLGELKVKARTSFKISKNLTALDEQNKIVEGTRKTLIEKYADPESVKTNPNRIEVMPEKIDEFSQEFDDLLKEKISFEIQPITVDDLGDVEVQPKIFAILNWLFVE